MSRPLWGQARGYGQNGSAEIVWQGQLDSYGQLGDQLPALHMLVPPSCGPPTDKTRVAWVGTS